MISMENRKNIFWCLILILLPYSLSGFDIPLRFSGRAFLGKYLNSDTSRYNMDASVKLYCTVIEQGPFSFFLDYQDDLDMAHQKGGVSLDPRYAHYYITGGFNYLNKAIYIAGYLIHDCIHDIDYDTPGTPVFNRFRIRIAAPDFHPLLRLKSTKRFIWSIDLGAYPHWKYHGWDINAGGDYRYDILVKSRLSIFKNSLFGVELAPEFHFTWGDTSLYHQHLARLQLYYSNLSRRIGIECSYHLYNNDSIKNPDKLWILSVFVEF